MRTTLPKAMRADLKSSFGGVFGSKHSNLKWPAAGLTGNPQAAGKALNAGSVKVLPAQYDDCKAELKQSPASAKQLFGGRELTAQYKELQKATPAEIRGMRSMWSVRQNGGTQTAAQAQLRADIGSGLTARLAQEAGPTKASVSEPADTAVEENMPKDLNKEQQTLIRSHIRYAALLLAEQTMDPDFHAAVLTRAKGYGFRAFPFDEMSPQCANGRNQTLGINGDGNGNRKLHFSFAAKNLSSIAVGSAEEHLNAIRLNPDPKDSENLPKVDISLDIRVALTDDGAVETTVKLAEPQTIHARLNLLADDGI